MSLIILSVFVNQFLISVRFIPIVSDPCRNCGSWNLAKEASKDPSVVITLSDFDYSLIGRFELYQFNLLCQECGCKENPFNMKKIIESGFWSTSPRNFSVLVSYNVLQMWDNLRKHMPGTSEKSFLDSLNDITFFNGRSGKILPSSFSIAFKEWCFCNYQLPTIQKQNWMECPCCTINQHSCHVDGNCKLYRYRNSGCRRRHTYYNDSFIESDLKVDHFVKSVYKNSSVKEKDFSCGGDWRAARNTQQKKRSVDITGLEVATCRHQFAQKALNMHQGELYAYPLYLIKHHMIPHNVEYAFADVMCKLWKFITRVDPHITGKIKGALSVMHAKGHSLQCQVNWDGEWKKGTGRSTGEECEQLFSYLSRASNTTKYQRPENREETITELAMFWNKRKACNISNALAIKYQRISTDFKERNSELNIICKSLGIASCNVNWDNWVKEIQLSAASDMLKLPKLTKFQAVILLYNDLKYVPPNLSTVVKRQLEVISVPDLTLIKIPLLSKTKQEKERLLVDYWDACEQVDLYLEFKKLKTIVIVPAFQIAIEKYYFEKVHWQTRLKKVAGTCKQRTMFRKKLSNVSKNFKLAISLYQQITSEFVRLEEGNFPWRNESIFSSISDEDKRLAVVTRMKMMRSEEEVILIRQDMNSYLSYYNSKSASLKSEIKSLEEKLADYENKNYVDGYISLLRSGLCFVETQQLSAVSAFSKILSPDTDLTGLLDSTALNDERFSELARTERESDEDDLDSDDFYDEIGIELILSSGEEIVSIYGNVPFTEVSLGNIDQMVLPVCFSQSTINGRNGSNACTVISLLTGYIMSKCGFLLDSNLNLPKVVISYVGCLEFGSSLYEEAQFLLIPEAILYIPRSMRMSIRNESNATLDSIEADIFANMNNEEPLDFFVVIVRGIAVCCVLSSGKCYIFDSHIHGSNGAILSFASMENLKFLIETSLSIQNDDLMYICYISID